MSSNPTPKRMSWEILADQESQQMSIERAVIEFSETNLEYVLRGSLNYPPPHV